MAKKGKAYVAKGHFCRSRSSDDLFRDLLDLNPLPIQNEDMKNSFLPGLFGGRGSKTKNDKASESKERSHVKYGKVKVTLSKGLVYREHVDVVVNSTSGNLALKWGQASRALAEAAGKGLQKECNQKYPEGIKYGEVAETGGWDLDCGYIFHGFLRPWNRLNNQPAEQVLEDFVELCLEKADGRMVSSIAFPALGTGGLGFPAKVAAKIMLQCVKEFEMTHKGSSLVDVRFVIFPKDDQHFKDFKAEMGRYSYTILHKPMTPLDFQIPAKSSDSRTVGNVTINLVKGSLTKQKVDVIVNSTNKKLQLNKGVLSSAILNAGGDDIQSQLDERYPEGIDTGQIAFTSAYKMEDVTAVYHCCPPHYSEKNKQECEEHLYLLIQSCLMMLSEQGHKTIAFPTLGFGYYSFPVESAAQSFFPAVQEFCVNNPNSSLKKVSVVLFPNDPNIDAIWKSYQSELGKLGLKPSPVEIRRPRQVPPAISLTPQPIVKATPSRGSREWFAMMYEEEVCIPKYWTHYKAGEKIKVCKRQQVQGHPPYILMEVDNRTSAIITNLVKTTWQTEHVGHGADARGLDVLGFRDIKITKIQRVENLNLFEGYCLERQRQFDKARIKGRRPKKLRDILKSSGAVQTSTNLKTDRKQCYEFLSDIFSEVNEHYMFHGTLESNMESVLSQGLDNRLAGDKAMFGSGAYGAESPTKSDQYVDAKDNRRKKNHKMLLIRMCLGDICLCDKPINYKRAPCKTCRNDKCTKHMNDHYDSVVGDGKWLFREFVVYDKRQSYPEYVISYDRV